MAARKNNRRVRHAETWRTRRKAACPDERSTPAGQAPDCGARAYFLEDDPIFMPGDIEEFEELDDVLASLAGIVVSLMVSVGLTSIFWALIQASCWDWVSWACTVASGAASKAETRRVL
jgi:hypothetical protein